MTNNNPHPQTFDEVALLPIIVSKLQRVGEIGNELANPPEDANLYWALGVLSQLPRLAKELQVLEQALQILAYDLPISAKEAAITL